MGVSEGRVRAWQSRVPSSPPPVPFTFPPGRTDVDLVHLDIAPKNSKGMKKWVSGRNPFTSKMVFI